MSQRTDGLRRILSSAAVYQAVQDALGARDFQRRFVTEYVRPPAAARVLDIGCGTAALLEHLPVDVAYHGFDLSSRYIAAATRRWGSRGRFFRASIAEAPALTGGNFDRAIAVGVLHHLADAGARELATLAARALAPDGALVTYDPAYTTRTGRVAEFLLSRDRGQHVRRPEEYRELVATAFAEVTVTPVAGHLRIPYTGCVVIARGPRG